MPVSPEHITNTDNNPISEIDSSSKAQEGEAPAETAGQLDDGEVIEAPNEEEVQPQKMVKAPNAPSKRRSRNTRQAAMLNTRRGVHFV